MARVVTVAALVLLASVRAATATTDLVEAKRHLENARALNDKKQFRAAIREYELAYRWSEQPNMLFNIGEVYRALTERAEGTREDAERSLEYFQRFLAARPTDPERGVIEHKMAQMRALLKKQQGSSPPTARAAAPSKRATDPVVAPSGERAPTAPRAPSSSTPPPAPTASARGADPAPAAPPTAPGHRSPRWLLGSELVLGGGTALGLALVGVGAYALSQNGRPACSLMAPATHCPEVVDSVATGAALLTVGGVVAIASVAALVLVERHARRRERASQALLLPVVAPGAVALELGGVW